MIANSSILKKKKKKVISLVEKMFSILFSKL